MIANISVIKYLFCILTDEKLEYKKEELFKECKGSRLVLLWRILFETEVNDVDLLKEQIYEYGSNLKEQDYLGREVFLMLVSLLNLVIKEKT